MEWWTSGIGSVISAEQINNGQIIGDASIQTGVVNACGAMFDPWLPNPCDEMDLEIILHHQASGASNLMPSEQAVISSGATCAKQVDGAAQETSHPQQHHQNQQNSHQLVLQGAVGAQVTRTTSDHQNQRHQTGANNKRNVVNILTGPNSRHSSAALSRTPTCPPTATSSPVSSIGSSSLNESSTLSNKSIVGARSQAAFESHHFHQLQPHPHSDLVLEQTNGTVCFSNNDLQRPAVKIDINDINNDDTNDININNNQDSLYIKTNGQLDYNEPIHPNKFNSHQSTGGCSLLNNNNISSNNNVAKYRSNINDDTTKQLTRRRSSQQQRTGTSNNNLVAPQKMRRCRHITDFVLADEEKRLLLKEGYTDFPLSCQMRPLSKNEERILRKIRRKIRNKKSAQCSRQRKKEYVEDLERKYAIIVRENEDLKRLVARLEQQTQVMVSSDHENEEQQSLSSSSNSSSSRDVDDQFRRHNQMVHSTIVDTTSTNNLHDDDKRHHADSQSLIVAQNHQHSQQQQQQHLCSPINDLIDWKDLLSHPSATTTSGGRLLQSISSSYS